GAGGGRGGGSDLGRLVRGACPAFSPPVSAVALRLPGGRRSGPGSVPEAPQGAGRRGVADVLGRLAHSRGRQSVSRPPACRVVAAVAISNGSYRGCGIGRARAESRRGGPRRRDPATDLDGLPAALRPSA